MFVAQERFGMDDSEEPKKWKTQEKTYRAARISGALGLSQKDVYIYYTILVQTMGLILCIYYVTYK